MLYPCTKCKRLVSMPFDDLELVTCWNTKGNNIVMASASGVKQIVDRIEVIEGQGHEFIAKDRIRLLWADEH